MGVLLEQIPNLEVALELHNGQNFEELDRKTLGFALNVLLVEIQMLKTAGEATEGGKEHSRENVILENTYIIRNRLGRNRDVKDAEDEDSEESKEHDKESPNLLREIPALS